MIWYYWIIAAIVFFIIEAVVPGLVSVWFGAGSIAAGIVSACGGGIALQLTVFVVVTVAALLALRPIAKRHNKQERKPSNADTVIGAEAKTITDILSDDWSGKVTVGSEVWSAQAIGEAIPEDTKVIVKELKGAHLMVEPLTDNN